VAVVANLIGYSLSGMQGANFDPMTGKSSCTQMNANTSVPLWPQGERSAIEASEKPAQNVKNAPIKD
jgi:hypothetical protein